MSVDTEKLKKQANFVTATRTLKLHEHTSSAPGS